MNKSDKSGAKIAIVLWSFAFILCIVLSIVGFENKHYFIGWTGIVYTICIGLLILGVIFEIKTKRGSK